MAHFETPEEIANFLRIHYSKEAILDKARKRKRSVSYQDPNLEANGLIRAVERLPDRNHREGKQILTTLIRCAAERARIVAILQSVADPQQKAILTQAAASLTPQHVYAWYMKLWHYTFKKIHAIEKRTVDAISDKLSSIAIPMNFGEIAKDSHI